MAKRRVPTHTHPGSPGATPSPVTPSIPRPQPGGLVAAKESGAAIDLCVRGVLETSLGSQILDHLNGESVGDPVTRFRQELEAQGLAGAIHPQVQRLVESTLRDTFPNGFTNGMRAGGLAGVQTRAGAALRSALAKEGVERPTCPGFRDMLMYASPDSAVRDGLPNPAAAAPPTSDHVGGAHAAVGARDAFTNRLALERTLGAAYLDYFNGFPIGDISSGFMQNGGTDPHVARALQKTFGANFATTVSRLAKADARAKLRSTFRSALRSSLTSAGLKKLPDRSFADLPELFGPTV